MHQHILIIQQVRGTKEDHLLKVETVIQRLQDKAGFQANIRKSFFMQKEVEYLEFLFISNGIKSQPKKIEALNQMLAPTNKQ